MRKNAREESTDQSDTAENHPRAGPHRLCDRSTSGSIGGRCTTLSEPTAGLTLATVDKRPSRPRADALPR